MRFENDNGPMDEGDDLLAAEYVVGVLSAEERQQAAARIECDPEFARLVEAWEARLSPLAVGYPEIEAPAGAKQKIDRVLFARDATSSAETTARGGLWQSLTFWRGLSIAAFALLVAALAVPLLGPQLSAPKHATQFIASLSPKNSAVSYLAYYDPAADSLSLSHVSGDRGSGHDFELWAIKGQANPVSLGVIPVGTSVRLKISPKIGQDLAKGGALAISVEPPGGSPTGQVTGPVVAVGSLHQI